MRFVRSHVVFERVLLTTIFFVFIVGCDAGSGSDDEIPAIIEGTYYSRSFHSEADYVYYYHWTEAYDPDDTRLDRKSEAHIELDYQWKMQVIQYGSTVQIVLSAVSTWTSDSHQLEGEDIGRRTHSTSVFNAFPTHGMSLYWLGTYDQTTGILEVVNQQKKSNSSRELIEVELTGIVLGNKISVTVGEELTYLDLKRREVHRQFSGGEGNRWEGETVIEGLSGEQKFVAVLENK